MSDYDEPENSNESFESNEFARQFAQFMRKSFAMTTTTNTPENPHNPEKVKYRIDTTPLVIGMQLNGDNYPLWAVLMKNAISGRGLIAHITGDPSPPSRTDPSFTQWQQADHCVFTWLTQNLEIKLISRVSQQPTAKHICDNLAITYASGSDAIQIFDLHRKANTLKQKEESLEDVWSMLQDLWVSIDQRKPNPMECPKDIQVYSQETQELRLYQFLTAIHERYEPVKKEILRIEPLPSVETAYAMVRREDAQSQVLRSDTSGDDHISLGIGTGLAVRDKGRPWQSSRPPASRGSGSGGGGGWNRKTEENKSKLVCTVWTEKTH